ncbi:MAG: putative outermembrane protein [uncultured Sulfurovum sp.]|uniref:Putative outermembrane protein n=1 Tax=uncultured Sulfurovum sp. TaxID=269237 RepID=A0A6S6TLZ0_9BACT|nr:MAG: putative outermembrane protein [uncultured Sulfurovum sp.]
MLQAFHKAVHVLFVLLLCTLSLFSTNDFSKQIKQLANNPQWHKLLHIKGHKSEIDDPTFFFSKKGKSNPKAELKASIEKLMSDKSDDENSTLCRYPSRSSWILEQLPELKKHIKLPKCTALNQELKDLGAKHITLIFASAHINSPASAFGHTFLRIDKDANTPLLSYAVNYAAQTAEDNGFVYAYQGLFGGYKGRYSIDPYYKKLHEYANLEQRDIWEYTLNLSPKEIDRMVRHIFEIRHFYADYFFLAENCSYNLLWLLEIAKEDVNLINQFKHKAIPIDTLRAVLSENLITKTTYRPSKRKEILNSAKAIKNNKQALNFAKSNDFDLTEIKKLPKKEKIASLELATALLRIKLAKQEISKEVYLKKFLILLKSRSQLGLQTKEEISHSSTPLEGHHSSKASFSFTNNQAFQTRIKVAYHDIYDNDTGFIPGAYINFFDTALGYKDNKLTLEEIHLLDIRSYALQDAIFKPISWEVSLGAKRIFNNELNSYLKAGGGITLGNKKFYGYATVTPTLYYKSKTTQSVSANIGLLYNPSKKLKLGLLTSNEWFSQKREIQEIEPFITYNFNQKSAINLRYEYSKMNEFEEKDLILSLFWYF